MGITAHRFEVSLWGGENILELVVLVEHIWDYTKKILYTFKE